MSERIVDIYPEETAERFQEIIRCMDCKRFHPKEGATLNCRFTHPKMPNAVEWCYAEPDGFCAWGIRKQEC